MATDERDVVTVFGLELTDRNGIERWSVELESGDELARIIQRKEGCDDNEIVSFHAGHGGFVSALGRDIDEAQRRLVENVRCTAAACQRFLELFGGDNE